MNTKPQKPALGTTMATIQLPEKLHDTMKSLRLIRRQIEGSDVKLSRLYREAAEQYVNAKPQQQLLKEWGNGNSRTGKATGD